MARTTHVKKARNDQGNCEKCGTPIKAGDPYKWVKPKTGPYGGRKRKRCASCPGWKPSELTTSRMAAVWSVQEELSNAQDPDTARSEIEAVAEAARDLADEYRESVDAMVEGFGHETQSSDDLAERADGLESWADELDQALSDMTDDVCEACDGSGEVMGDDGESDECPDCEGSGYNEEARQSIEAAYSLAEDCPV